MCHRSDISTIYWSKTDLSTIYRRYYRFFLDFSLNRLSITDIVSTLTNIRYIGLYIGYFKPWLRYELCGIHGQSFAMFKKHNYVVFSSCQFEICLCNTIRPVSRPTRSHSSAACTTVSHKHFYEIELAMPQLHVFMLTSFVMP